MPFPGLVTRTFASRSGSRPRSARLALGGAAVLLVLNLAACGNKGPLYLPDQPANSDQQQTDDAERNEQDR